MNALPEAYIAHRYRMYQPGTRVFDLVAMKLQALDAAYWALIAAECGYSPFSEQHVRRLDPATAVFVLCDGWREGTDPVSGLELPASEGVTRELAIAQECSIPVARTVHGLAWVRWYLRYGRHDPQATPPAEMIKQES